MKTYRVVVCGTLFGQVYLSAFKKHFPGFELAGILARGSERSITLAKKYGVALYREVDELPNDIDIACVVVRSAIVGGEGSQLAHALLKKGIHVLQEHPVYEKDVIECLKLAREKGIQYQINTHYPNVPAVRHFIEYLKKARETQQPCFIEATCGVQVVCGLLDILGQSLGGVTPFEFSAISDWSESMMRKSVVSPPYQVIQGVFAGIPLILKIQNQLDPDDPDNHFHIMHRITVGLPSGNLVLVNTHGPVLWNRAFHIPRKPLGNGVRELLDKQQAPEFYQPASCEVLFGEKPTLEEIIDEHWPNAIKQALQGMVKNIETPNRSTAQYLLGQAAVWRSLMGCIGNPEVISAQDPVPTSPSIVEWLTDFQQESDHA
ncbi:Gfo/Idh/MocA family oxidoreductase [Photobacterium sanguinicancri]|uniref:Gfo/Idh/MocA family oxidoreductase n=1 Tax=Photobacterium sanguinicancri TaxID=875932 RepID=A0AAW7Y8V2_9GAMM|nr:Gfo/Idh/MocA family oxidoreductase [Photobacterium sanguinicancri]MDO6544749.1 Gfo/Idh/MocA family oxidoreductase [Photobacterium sanguinicancri]